jgi:hypothetical protein
LDAPSSLQRASEPDMIPGLLQTRAYAPAILQYVVTSDGLSDAWDEGVCTRICRQRVLRLFTIEV